MSNENSISLAAQREAEQALYGQGPETRCEDGEWRLFWRGDEIIAAEGKDSLQIELNFFPDGGVIIRDSQDDMILLTAHQARQLSRLIHFYRT